MKNAWYDGFPSIGRPEDVVQEMREAVGGHIPHARDDSVIEHVFIQGDLVRFGREATVQVGALCADFGILASVPVTDTSSMGSPEQFPDRLDGEKRSKSLRRLIEAVGLKGWKKCGPDTEQDQARNQASGNRRNHRMEAP